MKEEVTIMSVFYSPETRILQALNKSLTDRLNPGNRHKWLFAENTKEKKEINPVQFNDPNAKVYAGVAGWREDIISWLRGSFNHAGGLELLLSHVETRFIVCTEPDFFVVRRNWLSEVVENMKSKKLAFFGAPYDPRRYTMYRYFPHIAFMAIDLSRIEKSTLDFRPITTEERDRSQNFFGYTLRRGKKKILGARGVIGTRRETGSRIYEKYHLTEKSECVVPVFSRKPSLLDRFLPENLSFVPHKKNYFSTEGFGQRGYTDLRNLYRWEEYMYKGEPFAFHMQGGKEKKDMDRELAVAKDFIERIR